MNESALDAIETGEAGSTSDRAVADSWEGCSSADLESYWSLPSVHLYRYVGSTNDVARMLAHEAAPNGTVVLSEEQRAGRGRGSRAWSSPPGVGLWLSIVLREIAPEALSLLPVRVAIVVGHALEGWTDRLVAIKWPNDLLIDDRKVGGILCESSWDGHRIDHVVVGIGLNLLQAHHEYPDSIRETATSLRAHATRPVSRFGVASDVFKGLRPLVLGLEVAPPEAVVAAFSARDALLGKNIEIQEVETRIPVRTGVAHGIDVAGALLLGAGESRIPIRSGTIRVVKP